MQCVSRSCRARKFSNPGAFSGSLPRSVLPVRTHGSTRDGCCSTSLVAPAHVRCTLTLPRNFSMESSIHTTANDSSVEVAQVSSSVIVDRVFRTKPSDRSIRSLSTTYLAIHRIVIGNTCQSKDWRFAVMTEVMARLSASMASSPHWPLLAVLADQRILGAVGKMRLQQFTAVCNAALLRLLSDDTARSNEVFFINDALRMLSHSNAAYPALHAAMQRAPQLLSGAIADGDFPVKSLLKFTEALIAWEWALPDAASAAILGKFAVWLTMQQSPGSSVDDALACVRYAAFSRLLHADFLDALHDFLAVRLRHCCRTSRLLAPTSAQQYFGLFAWCRRPAAHLFVTYAGRVRESPEIVARSTSRSLHAWIMVNWMFVLHGAPTPPEAAERLAELVMATVGGDGLRVPAAAVLHARRVAVGGALPAVAAARLARAAERAWRRSVPGRLSLAYAAAVPVAVAPVSCGAGFVDVALLVRTGASGERAPLAWSDRALSPHGVTVAAADAMAAGGHGAGGGSHRACVPVAVLLASPEQFAACSGAPCGVVEDVAFGLRRSGWRPVVVPVTKESSHDIVQLVRRAVEAELAPHGQRPQYRRFLHGVL